MSNFQGQFSVGFSFLGVFLEIKWKLQFLIRSIFGTPQRTMLGQLLFNIFLTDFFFISNEVDIASYADDNTPYVVADDINGVIKILLYCTMLHFTIYCTMLYYTIPHYTILYYTILYYTVLFYIVLYYTILYCYTIIILSLSLHDFFRWWWVMQRLPCNQRNQTVEVHHSIGKFNSYLPQQKVIWKLLLLLRDMDHKTTHFFKLQGIQCFEFFLQNGYSKSFVFNQVFIVIFLKSKTEETWCGLLNWYPKCFLQASP